MTVNKVILIGNLGQKPEVRSSGSGLSIARLRIATSDRRKGADGQWADATEWHSVVVFGNQAENCAKFLDKGRQVYVEGRLQTRKWQDKDGNDRRTTEVVASDVRFLSNRGDNASSSSGSSNYSSGGGYNSGGSGFSSGNDSFDDGGSSDIPF